MSFSEEWLAEKLKQGHVREVASGAVRRSTVIAALPNLTLIMPQWVLPPGAALGAALPIKLVSEKNQRIREHWSATHKRVKAQRSQVYESLSRLWDFGHTLGLPLTITITRIAPRALDDDNLQAACSGVRDGVSDWLAGTPLRGEDRQEGLVWHYDQRRVAAGFFCVEITIARPKKVTTH